MSQQELLTAVATTLDSMGIQYMVTGSIASSFYGEPRLSHDIDILLLVTAESAIRLAGAFPPPRFYLDPPEAIAEMVREESCSTLSTPPAVTKSISGYLRRAPMTGTVPTTCPRGRIRRRRLGLLLGRRHPVKAQLVDESREARSNFAMHSEFSRSSRGAWMSPTANGGRRRLESRSFGIGCSLRLGHRGRTRPSEG